MNLTRSFFTLLLIPVFSLTFSTRGLAGDFHDTSRADIRPIIVKTPAVGGIREEIPQKYKARYQRWKNEFLSTEFGRRQWNSYAANKRFILTIRMSSEQGQGAGTDGYLWDENGNFVGATITLGSKLDRGYPDPIYYPVMNSLSPGDNFYSVNGRILAATKFAHEIGHVNQAAKANFALVQKQNRLIPEYISIFLRNGHNVNDEKLIDLAAQMGGTPVEIWENREYWSEITALAFLQEKISREHFYCQILSKIRNNLRQYARDYEQRFIEATEPAVATCGK